MEILTRQDFLSALNQDWAGYSDQFHQLAPDQQAAFLQRQGYARLADLLAHVTAWWQEGLKNVRLLADEQEPPVVQYDVNAFNTAAVIRCQDQSEDMVIEAFEQARNEFLALIASLSDEKIAAERINRRLRMEIIGHYAEHHLKLSWSAFRFHLHFRGSRRKALLPAQA